MKLPAMQERFKPRAHAAILSNAVQEAWAKYQATMFPQGERDSVNETLATWIESLTPIADLAVLRRYGYTETTEHVTVRAHNGEDWRECFGLDLPRKIEMPRNSGTFYCGGAWHSRDPLRGCKPRYWETLSEQERAELIAHQDAQERVRVPESLEPFFAKLVEARGHMRDEYKTATQWPQSHKDETGEWPTWQQIADRFHVLGGYLKSNLQVAT